VVQVVQVVPVGLVFTTAGGVVVQVGQATTFFGVTAAAGTVVQVGQVTTIFGVTVTVGEAGFAQSQAQAVRSEGPFIGEVGQGTGRTGLADGVAAGVDGEHWQVEVLAGAGEALAGAAGVQPQVVLSDDPLNSDARRDPGRVVQGHGVAAGVDGEHWQVELPAALGTIRETPAGAGSAGVCEGKMAGGTLCTACGPGRGADLVPLGGAGATGA
jgi:hypothetical protein